MSTSIESIGPSLATPRASWPKKEALVSNFAALVASKRFILIGENKGLSTDHMNALRQTGRKQEVILKVMKNTLCKKALYSLPKVENFLVGQTIIALSDDEQTATRLFSDFITSTKLIDFKVAYIGGQIVNIDQLKELAVLGSKESLIASIAYLIKEAANLKS